MVLDAIYKGNGIYNEMGMQVICLVQMGRNQNLVTVSPETLRQFQTNFVGKLRRGLTGSKRLVAVVGKGSTFFTKAPFHHEHFLSGGIRMTIDSRNEAKHDGLFLVPYLLGRFPLLHSIADNI